MEEGSTVMNPIMANIMNFGLDALMCLRIIITIFYHPHNHPLVITHYM